MEIRGKVIHSDTKPGTVTYEITELHTGQVLWTKTVHRGIWSAHRPGGYAYQQAYDEMQEMMEFFLRDKGKI